MDLYKTLGVLKNATPEEIKTGYRSQSKVHHPDKGGDTETFKQIALAYEILSDPEKRQRYDSGEPVDSITKSAVSIETHILRQLVKLFTNVVFATDVKHTDIVGHMKNHLSNNLQQIAMAIQKERTKIEKLEIVIGKIKRVEGENIFVGSAQAQITNIKMGISTLENQKTHNEKALKMLEDYSYEADPNPGLPNFFQNVTWSTTGGI